MTIGEAMKTARKSKGYSQYRLSLKSGVTAQSISLYERDISYPCVLNLIDIADTLGVSLDELVGREIKRKE